MSINIDGSIIEEILNDGKFKDELCEFLHLVIDEEIEKGDEMDDNLVSDCVDALMALEENDIKRAVDKLRSSDNIIRFVHKKQFKAQNIKRSVAAAVALILVAHTAAYTTVPTYANSVDSFVQSIIEIINISSDKTDDGSDKYCEIRVTLPEDFNEHIGSLDEISLKDVKITAVDYDGNLTEIPIEECEIGEPTVIYDGSTAYAEITVSYKGNTEIIRFIMVLLEQEKVTK